MSDDNWHNQGFLAMTSDQMVAFLKGLVHQSVEDFEAILNRGGWSRRGRGCGVIPFQRDGMPGFINILVEPPHNKITDVTVSR
jgi:hypothetical protein